MCLFVRVRRADDSMHHQFKLSYINMAIRPRADARSIKKNKQIKVHLRGKVKLVTCVCVLHTCCHTFMYYCMYIVCINSFLGISKLCVHTINKED